MIISIVENKHKVPSQQEKYMMAQLIEEIKCKNFDKLFQQQNGKPHTNYD